MAAIELRQPPGWIKVTVAEVGEVRLGRQRSPDKHTGRFVTKYLRAANITVQGLNLDDVLEMDFTPAEREVFRLEDGDILLAEASGSGAKVGRPAIWRNEIPGCCYQNTVIRFRPHLAYPEYALTVFRYYTASGVFMRTARGVGIQHLGATRFSQLPFPLPPIDEQRRIAKEVERRLVKLEKAEQRLASALEKVVEQEKEIISAAISGKLVDLEVVVAKREGREYQDARSLLDDTLQPTRTTQSGLFEASSEPPSEVASRTQRSLPPGWTWCRIDELGQARLGKQVSPSEKRGRNPRPYLRVANVFEDYIDTADVKEMDFTDEECEVYRLKRGDLLLNEGQSPELVGRPAMYREELPDVCFQNTLIRFRPGPAVDPEYALLVFRHYLHTEEFKKVARWSTNIAHLGLQRFAGMAFPLPPLSEQNRIAKAARLRLQDSKTQADVVRASIDRLLEMKSEVLRTAVNGEIVRQNEDDEPASLLVKARGPNPRDRVARLSGTGDMEVPKKPKKSEKRSGQLVSPLAQVLRDAGRPLTLPELFSMAGYDRDSSEHVERFYLALREELGKGITQIDDSNENGVLEAVTNAPR